MRKYAKMFAVGAAAVILSGEAWFVPGTLSYAADTEDATAATTAAAVKCALAMDSQKVAPGDVFTVKVNLTQNPGTTLEDGILSYDTSVLELISGVDEDGTTVYSVESADLFHIQEYNVDETSMFESPIPHDGKVRLLDGYAKYEKNTDVTGTMFTLTFKVKDDAVVGTKGTFKYEGIFYGYLTQSESSAYTAECDDLIFTVVECTHQNTTEKITEPDYGKKGEKQIVCQKCQTVIATEEIPALEFVDAEDEKQLQVKDVTEAENTNYDENYVSKLLKDQTTEVANVQFKFYEINMLDESGNIVEPEGTVTVRFPCPEGFDGTKCRIYFVAESGALTDMKAVFKEGYFFFETTHFSTYLLTDTELVTETAPEPEPEPEPEPKPELPKQFLYGDANGDGQVSLTDSALIRRFLAAWNVTIDADAADVNLDGKVSLTDSALIRRFLAGWNVTLGPAAE